MFSRGLIRRALTGVPALTFLAGCSTNAVTPAMRFISAALLAPARPAAQHYGNDWVYSTSPNDDDATAYHRKGTKLKYDETLSLSIATTAEGTFATPSGYWYVTNPEIDYGTNSSVLVYQSTTAGPKGPVATLDDSGETPINVAVMPNRDLVAVSNVLGGLSRNGNVSVYVNGATQPSRTLSYGSSAIAGDGIAIDQAGNCYWSFDEAGTTKELGSIVEFSKCSGSGTPIISGLADAGGLAFDNDGNLYYIDEASGVYKCKGITDCKLFATGFGLAVSLNFDAKDKHLWVADATGYLDAVDPKSGAIESQTLSVNGDPFGIAPSPGG
jgi:hypothetical protein